jgi:hypothetical protein
LSLLGVTSLSLLTHGEVGLDRIGGDARAPAKSYELGVYDSEGYVMACVAFYEQGFGLPSHRFLCSLLQF